MQFNSITKKNNNMNLFIKVLFKMILKTYIDKNTAFVDLKKIQ